jgi:hypothetical protein
MKKRKTAHDQNLKNMRKIFMTQQAEESNAIKKARKKLEKILSKQDQMITKNALNEIKKTMHHWIERHRPERTNISAVVTKDFDENKHFAKTKSAFIINLIKKLEPQFKRIKKENKT